MSIANWFRCGAERDLRRNRRERFVAMQWTNPALKDLLQRWGEAESRLSHLSSPWYAVHSLFAETVAMGQPVVPFLLVELARNPRQWIFSVLREITKENPVLQGHRGMSDKMTGDWLQWGEEKGYLPAE